MPEEALSADDKKWKAESDARSLAEAETIKGDKTRFEAARKAAQGLSKEKQKEAEAMDSVAATLFPEMVNKEA